MGRRQTDQADLDRDRTIEARVTRAIDPFHTSAEEADNPQGDGTVRTLLLLGIKNTVVTGWAGPVPRRIVVSTGSWKGSVGPVCRPNRKARM